MIKQTIEQAYTQAVLNRNEPERDALKMIKSSFLTLEKEKAFRGTEQEYLLVLQKLLKQRKESSEIYQKAGREDLVKQEESEIKEISKYLPQQLSEQEVEDLIREVSTQQNLELVSKNKGLIMKSVLQKASGRTDGKTISTVLDQLL